MRRGEEILFQLTPLDDAASKPLDVGGLGNLIAHLLYTTELITQWSPKISRREGTLTTLDNRNVGYQDSRCWAGLARTQSSADMNSAPRRATRTWQAAEATMSSSPGRAPKMRSARQATTSWSTAIWTSLRETTSPAVRAKTCSSWTKAGGGGRALANHGFGLIARLRTELEAAGAPVMTGPRSRGLRCGAGRAMMQASLI